MEQVNITLTFDSKRLEALEFFLQQEKTTVQKRMEESLRQLYEQTVPEVMRGFLDWKAAPNSKPKRPVSKPASKPQPKVEPPQAAPSEADQKGEKTDDRDTH